MKTLSVKQPWATLIASGIKDIENRTWAPPKSEERILIHASSAKVPKTICDRIIFDQASVLSNEQKFGNIPASDDMPCSAIVGYVTVKGACNNSNSIWAEPVDFQWILEDAYLFDEPILNVNGKLHLWDYPEIDENNLPAAHKVERKEPTLEGNCLVVPLNNNDYDEALNDEALYLEPTYELADVIEKPEEEAKEGESHVKAIPRIKLVSPKGSQCFAVKSMGYVNYLDKQDQLLKVIDWNMEETEYFNLQIELGEKES